jgi:hypothetical protein
MDLRKQLKEELQRRNIYGVSVEKYAALQQDLESREKVSQRILREVNLKWRDLLESVRGLQWRAANAKDSQELRERLVVELEVLVGKLESQVKSLEALSLEK